MDKPIIFSGPMVRALLDGRKTMTRRLAWREPRDPSTHRIADSYQRPSPWQKVQPGGRLWVKESHWRLGRWMQRLGSDGKPHWEFLPENETPDSVMFERPAEAFIREHRAHDDLAWWLRPSIFHPKALGRLTLIVTATKVEPLQEISREDEIAEGTPDGMFFDALWSSIHGPESWDANPEVVALTFRVIRENIDRMTAGER